MLALHGPRAEQVAEAVREGADDVIDPSLDLRDLAERVRRAMTGGRGLGRACEDGFEGLIGTSARMRRVYELIRTVSSASSTILLTGESGTGKRRIAEVIHARSPRRDGPLVRLNCAAFSGEVLDAELFGGESERPAGSGALRAAQGGTLLLEDVGCLPLPTQSRLLSALSERTRRDVDSCASEKFDFRLIAATDADLSERVRSGRLREDLYFKLSVIPIVLPPLRDRPEDIPLIASHLVGRYSREAGRRIRGFTERAGRALERHRWPGNVRELENAVERAVILASSDVIDLHDLPDEIRGGRGELREGIRVETTRLAEVEEIVVREVLVRSGWNVKRSAELLGITRATLYSKIRKFGLTLVR
jgi:DNA-binding NtrC family response regulator